MFSFHTPYFICVSSSARISFCTSIQLKYKHFLAGPPLGGGGEKAFTPGPEPSVGGPECTRMVRPCMGGGEKSLHRGLNPLSTVLNVPGWFALARGGRKVFTPGPEPSLGSPESTRMVRPCTGRGWGEKSLHRGPNPLSAVLNVPGQAILERLKAKSQDWVGGVPCTRSHSDEKSRHSSDVFRSRYVTQQDPCNDWIPAECTIICIQAYNEASGDNRVTHFYLLCGGTEITFCEPHSSSPEQCLSNCETHTTSETR